LALSVNRQRPWLVASPIAGGSYFVVRHYYTPRVMKEHIICLIFTTQVLLLAGCSKSASITNKYPIEMQNITNAEDMQTISNILTSANWPIFQKAESGKFGRITIPLASGTNLDSRHYNITWSGSGWQISPTNQ